MNPCLLCLVFLTCTFDLISCNSFAHLQFELSQFNAHVVFSKVKLVKLSVRMNKVVLCYAIHFSLRQQI